MWIGLGAPSPGIPPGVAGPPAGKRFCFCAPVIYLYASLWCRGVCKQCLMPQVVSRTAPLAKQHVPMEISKLAIVLLVHSWS